MSVDAWVDDISNFSFICPTCHDISMRLNTLVKHMKSCMKGTGTKEYFNAELKCPECNFKNTLDRLVNHFRVKHLLVSLFVVSLFVVKHDVRSSFYYVIERLGSYFCFILNKLLCCYLAALVPRRD